MPSCHDPRFVRIIPGQRTPIAALLPPSPAAGCIHRSRHWRNPVAHVDCAYALCVLENWTPALIEPAIPKRSIDVPRVLVEHGVHGSLTAVLSILPAKVTPSRLGALPHRPRRLRAMAIAARHLPNPEPASRLSPLALPPCSPLPPGTAWRSAPRRADIPRRSGDPLPRRRV